MLLAWRQDRAREQKLHNLADRERQAIMFGREAAAPQASAPERQTEARIASVRASLHAERDAYAGDQAKERQTLDARHAAENRQLDAAATHRLAQDRVAERELRRDAGHERAQQERVLGRDTGRTLG